MKYIDKGEFGMPQLELTRRNLTTLLAKLDGHPPDSACTILDPDRKIAVKAVENEEHYADRAPGSVHPQTLDVMDVPIESNRMD